MPGTSGLRRSQVVLAVMVVALCVALLLTAALRPQRRSHPSPRPAAIPADGPFTTTAAVVKTGEILPVLLGRAGLTSAEIGTVIPALRNAGFSFRQVLPGDSVLLLRRDGMLKRVLYQRNYETVYRIDVESSYCCVSMLLRNCRKELTAVKGIIKGSLYQSLLDLGENPALVADYTDVFGWEVDFFSDPQPGDSFVILFERKFADDRLVGYGAILAAGYYGQTGRFTGFRYTDPDSHTDYYNAEGQSLRKVFLKSPLRFSRISSHFGRRFHPIRRVVKAHLGVDYVAQSGTPVECVADGRVVTAGWSGGYGRLVKVGHADGYTTFYGHLNGFAKGVRAGAPVVQGQVIGYVGSTGLSTGPHLHYEVRLFGNPANPLRLNPPRLSPVRLAFQDQFNVLRDSLSRMMNGLDRARPRQPALTQR